MTNYRIDTTEAIAGVARALGDSHRLRALLALREGELCVCQLIELLGLSPSTVSKHMSILAQAGLVRHRKEGRWVHYRIEEKESPPEARRALRWLRECAQAPDGQLLEDQKRLERIRTADLPALCSTQRGRAGAAPALLQPDRRRPLR
jgi:DNA-binding transcriptional ArsR family regulator